MSMRALTAITLGAVSVVSGSAGAVAPAPIRPSVRVVIADGTSPAERSAARVVDPLVAPGAKLERHISGFRADGREFAVVLDTAQVPAVGSRARITIVQAGREGTPPLALPSREAGGAVGEDPNDPPTPYIKGHGSEQMLCTPAYAYLARDEECLAKKQAADNAATLICVDSIVLAALTGGWGAAAASAMCLAAKTAAAQIHCDPILVNVPEFCTRMHPKEAEPQRQEARKKYKEQTGQDPPDDPCATRKDAGDSDGEIRHHPPICQD
jgi:hypothetical protein